MNGIQSDLHDGQMFEDFILKKLQEEYPLSTKKDGYFPDYDIEIPEKNEKLECKFDRMSKKTGNLAIEFEYNKNPSGINRSKADKWVLGYFNSKKNVWMYGIVESEKLKNACTGKRVVNGGDRMASKMYLLSVDDFESIDGIEIFETKSN